MKFLADAMFTAIGHFGNDENFITLEAFQFLGTKINASKFYMLLIFIKKNI